MAKREQDQMKVRKAKDPARHQRLLLPIQRLARNAQFLADRIRDARDHVRDGDDGLALIALDEVDVDSVTEELYPVIAELKLEEAVIKTRERHARPDAFRREREDSDGGG